LRGGPFCKKGLPAPLSKNFHNLPFERLPPMAEASQRLKDALFSQRHGVPKRVGVPNETTKPINDNS